MSEYRRQAHSKYKLPGGLLPPVNLGEGPGSTHANSGLRTDSKMASFVAVPDRKATSSPFRHSGQFSNSFTSLASLKDLSDRDLPAKAGPRNNNSNSSNNNNNNSSHSHQGSNHSNHSSSSNSTKDVSIPTTPRSSSPATAALSPVDEINSPKSPTEAAYSSGQTPPYLRNMTMKRRNHSKSATPPPSTPGLLGRTGDSGKKTKDDIQASPRFLDVNNTQWREAATSHNSTANFGPNSNSNSTTGMPQRSASSWMMNTIAPMALMGHNGLRNGQGGNKNGRAFDLGDVLSRDDDSDSTSSRSASRSRSLSHDPEELSGRAGSPSGMDDWDGDNRLNMLMAISGDIPQTPMSAGGGFSDDFTNDSPGSPPMSAGGVGWMSHHGEDADALGIMEKLDPAPTLVDYTALIDDYGDLGSQEVRTQKIQEFKRKLQERAQQDSEPAAKSISVVDATQHMKSNLISNVGAQIGSVETRLSKKLELFQANLEALIDLKARAKETVLAFKKETLTSYDTFNSQLDHIRAIQESSEAIELLEERIGNCRAKVTEYKERLKTVNQWIDEQERFDRLWSRRKRAAFKITVSVLVVILLISSLVLFVATLKGGFGKGLKLGFKRAKGSTVTLSKQSQFDDVLQCLGDFDHCRFKNDLKEL